MTTLDRNLSLPAGIAPIATPRGRHRVPATGRLLLALLARLERGSLVVETPDGASTWFGQHDADPAVLSIHDWRVARDTMQRGSVRACAAAAGPRHFSAAGCEIPDRTPEANILAHARVLREIG